MEIAVISDLHISRDNADGFLHDESAFLQFLMRLESNFEKIVLLGDIFDTLTGPDFRNPKKEFWQAVAAYPYVGNRLLSEKYVYVYGNHDMSAQSTVTALEEYIVHKDGLRILFTHGHQYDWVAQRARGSVEFLIWLGGYIKRLGLKSLYDILSYIDEYIGGTGTTPEHCMFTQWALRLAEQRGYDWVVTGHTHKISSFHSKNTVYLNSGTCSHGLFQFCTIDTKQQRYAYHTEPI